MKMKFISSTIKSKIQRIVVESVVIVLRTVVLLLLERLAKLHIHFTRNSAGTAGTLFLIVPTFFNR